MDLDTDVAVIGGGVAGLTAAWRLAASGKQVTLFEARSRLGGRVQTAAPAPLAGRPWVDLGPAWFWPHQRAIRSVVDLMGLSVVEQYREGLAMYDAGHGDAPDAFDASMQSSPAYRLDGGIASLVDALAAGMQAAARQAAVPPVSVRLHAAVQSLAQHPDGVVVRGHGFRCTANRVVMAVPPRVVARDVSWTPPLPDSVREILADTVTWMGHAMKCVVSYEAPFWRTAGRSGYAVSWRGPLREIHDACTPAGASHVAAYALMGFASPRTTHAAIAFRNATMDERRAAVIAQLERLFGVGARDVVDYADYDWSRDVHSSGVRDDQPAAEHPVYGHAIFEGRFDLPAWNDRVVWAGAETTAIGGGYLEGAVASGLRAAATIASVRSTP